MSSGKRQGGIDRTAALDLIGTACTLHTQRLTVANSGNVSLRHERGFLITPSGVLYEQLTPQDIVHVGLDGEGDTPAVLAGTRTPSSEWRFHRDIYRAARGWRDSAYPLAFLFGAGLPAA
jgi:ribulose-5-phosphate 4-epimerase/fuculose-1-phosphate aldolase